jgi:ribokinase
MAVPRNSEHLYGVQLVGLGQACVDYLGRLDALPREDEKVELRDLVEQCGGPASTALVTLSRLGIPVAFMGSVSDDLFGVKIGKNLRDQGVDISHLKITPGYTSQFAFIAVTEGEGNRTIFWHRGTVPHLEPEDVNLEAFPNSRILHLDGLMTEASVAAASRARTMGMTVTLDGGTFREGSRPLIGLVDILIASETFADPLVGSDASPEVALHALAELGPGQVVITYGSAGSVGLDRSTVLRQKAFPIAAVDTTGAGDVYHGGYLYGLLQNWDMAACMRFASAAAALKCRQMGAQAGIPDLDSIGELMRSHPDV